MVAPRTTSILTNDQLGSLFDPAGQATFNSQERVPTIVGEPLPPVSADPSVPSSTSSSKTVASNPQAVGMSGPRTVAQIKKNLLQPATTSHFYVRVPIPPELQSAMGTNQEQLNLLCSEAVLPGSNLATMDINNDFTGVSEKHAYRRVFDDRINLTFYVDAINYLPIRFFEMWMSFIMNEGSGSVSPSEPGTLGNNYYYRCRYPDEYTSQSGMEVSKFEKDYRNSLTYRFVKSYPISINSMPVTYEGSQLLRCTVSLTYIRYVVVQTSNFMSQSEVGSTAIERGETILIDQGSDFEHTAVKDPTHGHVIRSYQKGSTLPKDSKGQIIRTNDDGSWTTEYQQQANPKGAVMSSDIRLKENIIKVGRSLSGFNIYEWNYIGGFSRYRGVMAQEVMKVVPEAVTIMRNGFLGVHYDMIDVDMELAH